MDGLDLIELLKRGEDSKTQFKSIFDSIDSLAVEISAMANSEGGMIIVGVSDTGEIVGLDRDYIKKLNQWISNSASQKIIPQVF